MMQPALSSPTFTAQQIFAQAVALQKAERYAEAIPLYQALLALGAERENAAVWHNLGLCLRKEEVFETAHAHLRRAVEINPHNPSFLCSLANCLKDMERMEEACALYQQAFTLAPQDNVIRRNYALCLRDMEQFDEAIRLLEEGEKEEYTAWDIGIAHLYKGDLCKGWVGFETRWEHKGFKRNPVDSPRWQGEDLEGKTILLIGEQGFGDTILCSRYIPLLKQKGARVLLACKDTLHRLFRGMAGLDRLLSLDKCDEPVDYHLSMMSLPFAFQTTLETIPPPPSFCVPEPSAEIRALLQKAGKRLKVGIVWSGSVTFLKNRQRAVTLKHFLPLATIPNVQLFSLQKGVCAHALQEEQAESIVLDMNPFLHDFADTAAAISQLDMVVMTDSAVVHLTGSLGKPIWNLLNAPAYWLYGTEREDCPWYPSLRLFRQKKAGDWQEVFDRLTLALTQKAQEKISHA